ncbi:hypothetical protein OKW45_005988 [Paraburkholderia sp. WSM4175]
MLEENWKDLRFQTIQQFLEAACTSERRHLLDLFIPFALSKSDPKHGNGTLRNALIEKNWVNAAWLYNGPGYSENNYDDQLKKAYEKIKTGALRV